MVGVCFMRGGCWNFTAPAKEKLSFFPPGAIRLSVAVFKNTFPEDSVRSSSVLFGNIFYFFFLHDDISG